jgi:hypothetical protein
MSAARHRPHYLDSILLMQGEDRASDAQQASRRLWWLIIGLALLAVFLIGVMW